jgi:hypothetical protein
MNVNMIIVLYKCHTVFVRNVRLLTINVSIFLHSIHVIERRMKCTNRSENHIFDQPTMTKQKTMCLLVLFASRVADPDPGSGIRCFLTPRS